MCCLKCPGSSHQGSFIHYLLLLLFRSFLLLVFFCAPSRASLIQTAKNKEKVHLSSKYTKERSWTHTINNTPSLFKSVKKKNSRKPITHSYVLEKFAILALKNRKIISGENKLRESEWLQRSTKKTRVNRY